MMRWNQQHRRRTETPWQGGEPGQNRTNRLFPCDLHPANNTKYTFYCLVACQASAPNMAKAALPYQCTGTSSSTIRTVPTCASSAYQHNYLSVMFGDGPASSCEQKATRTSFDQRRGSLKKAFFNLTTDRRWRRYQLALAVARCEPAGVAFPGDKHHIHSGMLT